MFSLLRQTINRGRMPAQDARANPRPARHCQAPDFGETGYRVDGTWLLLGTIAQLGRALRRGG
jgi:hypothetical protein